MKLDQHYVEPRLVELYDSTNARGADTEFYVQLARELTESLSNGGFTVEHVYGDWNRGPVTSTSRILVFIARRTGA